MESTNAFNDGNPFGSGISTTSGSMIRIVHGFLTRILRVGPQGSGPTITILSICPSTCQYTHSDSAYLARKVSMFGPSFCWTRVPFTPDTDKDAEADASTCDRT